MFENDAYKRKCPICGEKLTTDDIEYRFDGNQDEYSICNHCHTHFLFYYRYGHLWKYDKTKMYFDENDKCWYSSGNPKDTETIYVYKKENSK